MNWTVKITMTLGHEKEEYTETVDLDGDVREVLLKMANMKNTSISTIENAYDSILKSAGTEWSVKARRQKKK